MVNYVCKQFFYMILTLYNFISLFQVDCSWLLCLRVVFWGNRCHSGVALELNCILLHYLIFPCCRIFYKKGEIFAPVMPSPPTSNSNKVMPYLTHILMLQVTGVISGILEYVYFREFWLSRRFLAVSDFHLYNVMKGES